MLSLSIGSLTHVVMLLLLQTALHCLSCLHKSVWSQGCTVDTIGESVTLQKVRAVA